MARLPPQKWPASFLAPRAGLENISKLFSETEKSENASLLELFLREQYWDWEDLDGSPEAAATEEFCDGTTLQDLRAGADTDKSSRAIAWIGVTSHNLAQCGSGFGVAVPLTPREFHQKLKSLKANSYGQLKNVKQIKAYVQLNDQAILALADTATRQEAPAIREAIFRHMTFRPAMGVQTTNYPLHSFQLILDLPYYVLRETRTEPDDVFPPELPSRSRPPRDMLDVSFLGIPPVDGNGEWNVYGTHFSLIITGIDEQRWSAYGFGDPLFDGLFADMTVDDLRMDQNAHRYLTVEMENNPREYYIRVSQIRISLVRKAWATIASRLSESIDRAIRDYSALGGIFGEDQVDGFEVFWDRLKLVLDKLEATLSSTIKVLKGFRDEDDEYFSDIFESQVGKIHRVKLWLGDIDRELKCLRQVREDFKLLRGRCEDHLQNLEQKLQRVLDRGNRHTNTMATLVWAPVIVTAGLFSMNSSASPITLSKRNFGLVLLACFIISLVSLTFIKWISKISSQVGGSVCQLRRRFAIETGRRPRIMDRVSSLFPRRRDETRGTKVVAEVHYVASRSQPPTSDALIRQRSNLGTTSTHTLNDPTPEAAATPEPPPGPSSEPTNHEEHPPPPPLPPPPAVTTAPTDETGYVAVCIEAIGRRIKSFGSTICPHPHGAAPPQAGQIGHRIWAISVSLPRWTFRQLERGFSWIYVSTTPNSSSTAGVREPRDNETVEMV